MLELAGAFSFANGIFAQIILSFYKNKKTQMSSSRASHPNHVPVIVEAVKPLKLPQCKFLLSPDMTVGQFTDRLRTQIKLQPVEAMFFTIKTKNTEVYVAGSQLMSQVLNTYKNESGELQVVVRSEEVFG
jgi:hypothetical protein